ncbi:MAG: peptide-methionine (S)-S-oxide reductase MsrA [Saprospiraceae bacterium]|nr:peptide-methionine (S)-S-oxide reductase MsrA [Saprospiraceae bacterium]
MSNILFAFITLFSLTTCTTNTTTQDNSNKQEKSVDLTGTETAVFASGCFWCVEAVFESVEGVAEAVSGYAGGEAKTANYPMVSAGRTKHAEAVEVYYDPKIVSYETLLEVFFGSQDPTTLNQQGPDRGTQYRSTIFYKNEAEKTAAEKYIAELTEKKVFDGPITTTLEPLVKFYKAEDYHQNYEERNPNQPYVRSVSVPRLNKFKSKFPHLLKKSTSKH